MTGPEQPSTSGTHPDDWDVMVGPFWAEASAEAHARQLRWHDSLRSDLPDVTFGHDVYVSRFAHVTAATLQLGDNTYVAAHVQLWGEVRFGANCTVNTFSEVRGRVTGGDGVRIGAHSSLLGFNHGMAVDEPIYRQPLTMRGIEIGDDVWIGAHVIIVDGVRVGAHSIIGAGAVVTKDVAPWAVVAGNPARRIRDRRASAHAGRVDWSTRLGELVQRVRAETPTLLARCRQADGEGFTFVDRPGQPPTVRAWCDAVEVAHLLTGGPPADTSAAEVIAFLTSRQDPDTGLLPELPDVLPAEANGDLADYHVLCAGYALQLLDARYPFPIGAVASLTAPQLRAELAGLEWNTDGWRAGARVDHLGTAMWWNHTDFGLDTEIDTLVGWLIRHCDRATGLWSPPNARLGHRDAVNGLYRLTRGTFAQFGIPLPYPERTIDSVLAHSNNQRFFRDDRGTACDVLDVIHPLWLAGHQTGHRRTDGEAWARRQLERVLRSWQDDAGFSFSLNRGPRPHDQPGLQGTEMWLAITWYLADYLDEESVLEFRPAGIHRPASISF